MNANKIVLNGEVLIDLTQDTAQDGDVTLGKTYHRADGSLGVGTHECEVGIQPSGTLLITANDEYDVTNYAKAQVAVPAIIEVTELPTTNIDTNAVYSMGGKLYRYEDSLISTNINTLAGTTWYVKSGFSATSDYGLFKVNGSTETGASPFSLIGIGYFNKNPKENVITFYQNTDKTGSTEAIGSTLTVTFTITGGKDVANTDLIEWLKIYGKLRAGGEYQWVEYLTPEGELAITENGTHDVKDKASVNVNVPIPEDYVKPEGEVTLTSNGSHNVSGKATAKVNVPIPALEGTAIPVGEPVERIYFNTNLTIEETNAYLSQLSYANNTYIVFCYSVGDTANAVIIDASIEGRYIIAYTDINGDWTLPVFEGQWKSDVAEGVSVTVDSADISGNTSLTDFQGLPIGLENEKIKNVMSITPFVAEGSDNYKLFGQWKFKAELPVPSEDIIQEVNFTSASGLNFNKMEITYVDEGTLVYFYKTDTGESIEVYAPDGTFWENYREVNFGTTPQSVSKAYYDYAMANAEFVIVSEWDGSFTKTTD